MSSPFFHASVAFAAPWVQCILWHTQFAQIPDRQRGGQASAVSIEVERGFFQKDMFAREQRILCHGIVKRVRRTQTRTVSLVVFLPSICDSLIQMSHYCTRSRAVPRKKSRSCDCDDTPRLSTRRSASSDAHVPWCCSIIACSTSISVLRPMACFKPLVLQDI